MTLTNRHTDEKRPPAILSLSLWGLWPEGGECPVAGSESGFMNEQERSEKHEQARSGLPDDLKPVFDELVEDYRFATVKQYGQGYVAYIVLADLVRVGWRHTADPLPDTR